MFEDRRGRGDRRQQRNTPQHDACRRVGERRNILRQYHPQPWWLQTNYVEELQPPTLDPAAETRANSHPARTSEI